VAVSHDDVRRIAGLARIAVPDAQLDEVARQLSGILGHMDALAAVSDSSALADSEKNAEGMRLADDKGPSVELERASDTIAPSWRDGFFLVPRLSTHDTAGES
jgi:aspartyl-tRNA(Asn)/glutamyl-tRNA(Gln) amidotransferase subunit C